MFSQQPHEINEVKISGPEIVCGLHGFRYRLSNVHVCGLEWSEAHTALFVMLVCTPR